MYMYDLDVFGNDKKLWRLFGLCAVTGGYIFIIVSDSDVSIIGLEHIYLFWSVNEVSVEADVGYFIGIRIYIEHDEVFHR